MSEMVYYPRPITRDLADPSRCNHQAPKMFIGTVFVDNRWRHRIVQLRRCINCGQVFETERDIRSAGPSQAVDVDDPRVKRTLLYSRSVDDRYFKEFNDGRCGFVRGADLS